LYDFYYSIKIFYFFIDLLLTYQRQKKMIYLNKIYYNLFLYFSNSIINLPLEYNNLIKIFYLNFYNISNVYLIAIYFFNFFIKNISFILYFLI